MFIDLLFVDLCKRKQIIMKASELRVGNLVNLFKGISDDGVVYDVYDIDSFDIYKLDEGECDDIKSILLTEEWLLKLGFEKSVMCYVNFSFVLNEWTNGCFMYGYIGGNIELKYVHQLQNLYFALIGEELTTTK